MTFEIKNFRKKKQKLFLFIISIQLLPKSVKTVQPQLKKRLAKSYFLQREVQIFIFFNSPLTQTETPSPRFPDLQEQTASKSPLFFFSFKEHSACRWQGPF